MITPSGDYLVGEVMHLVKAGDHCEGVHDCLIDTAPGEALESAAERAQTSGAANSGPDCGDGETKLHHENPPQADNRPPTLTYGMCESFR
jgi:hypothetical protein